MQVTLGGGFILTMEVIKGVKIKSKLRYLGQNRLKYRLVKQPLQA